MQCYAALMVGSGVASVEEIASGHTQTGTAGLGPPAGPGSVAAAQKIASVPFERPEGSAPAFCAGSSVQTKPHATSGHTRLPSYVRGHSGEVSHVRGTFVFPDDSAKGIERAEPLYTVAFRASNLWPGEGCTHLVHLDLWESYLDPA